MTIDDENEREAAQKRQDPDGQVEETSSHRTAGPPAGGDGAGSAAAPDKPEKPPRSGKGLGFMALLLALLALGGAGYLYYALIYTNPSEGLASRLEATESEVQTLQSRLGRLGERQSAALAELEQKQAAALAASQQALLERLNDVQRQGPPEPREWRLAEAQYLLRIANHRVLMERDVPSALKLLRAADQILAELDDFALHPVRARLADEILALERVQGVDVQGLFLRLEALKANLDDLPLRLPEYLARKDAPRESPEGFWPALKAELESYLQLRRFDGTVAPLLAPDEAVYLELNLRLMLERAQLAVLRRDQVIYTQSLATAQAWIEDYLDPESQAVQQTREELQALGAISLDRPLPDISGSLNALAAALRSPS